MPVWLAVSVSSPADSLSVTFPPSSTSPSTSAFFTADRQKRKKLTWVCNLPDDKKSGSMGDSVWGSSSRDYAFSFLQLGEHFGHHFERLERLAGDDDEKVL